MEIDTPVPNSGVPSMVFMTRLSHSMIYPIRRALKTMIQAAMPRSPVSREGGGTE